MTKKYDPQLSFFDHSLRIEKIKEKDKLRNLKELIPWDKFKRELEDGFGRAESYAQGGRPGFDVVKMFRVLLLQRLYGLSDEGMEYALNDRLSFQEFVGFGPQEVIPDEKTVWLYREKLTKSGKVESLFNRFERYLSDRGFEAKKGIILDATVVEVPKRGITPKNYKEIKEGKVPEKWEENQSKRSQLDVEARFTSKDKGRTFKYGYKAHVRVDVKNKLIRGCVVSEASVNESQVAVELLKNQKSAGSVYADSAYDTVEIHQEVERLKLKDGILKQRRSKLEPEDKYEKYNHVRSKIRCRVEHVFGHLKNSMKAGLIRCVGKVRAAAIIVLNNLAYNMDRYRFLAT